MSATTKILIPYAITEDRRLLHIRDYRKGSDTAFCLSCGDSLIARQGKLKQWHYSHRGAQCSGEGALHQAAKLLIKQSFERALANAKDYHLRWTCPGCRTTRSLDCTKIARCARVESVVTDGVRADIYFCDGSKDFCVEVVVTHDLEDATREKYREINIPLFTLKPSWQTVQSLEHGIDASEAFHLNLERCPGCRERQQEKLKRVQDREKMRSFLEHLSPGDTSKLVFWAMDARGNQLYPKVKQQLYAHARNLLKIGFRQARKKPWLFLLPISNKRGIVFANLGGTEEVPIWEDTSPLLHWQLKVSEREERMIVHEVAEHCRGRNVPVRFSFYDGHFDPEVKEQYNDD